MFIKVNHRSDPYNICIKSPIGIQLQWAEDSAGDDLRSAYLFSDIKGKGNIKPGHERTTGRTSEPPEPSSKTPGVELTKDKTIVSTVRTGRIRNPISLCH